MGLLDAIVPGLGLASSIFNGITQSKANNKAAGLLANTQYGAANDITDATGKAMGTVATGGNDAIQKVGDATAAANQNLEEKLGAQLANTQPYQAAGQAASSLIPGISKPSSFTIQDWMNDPGFQFLMQQGSNAVKANAAARGLASSGNVLQDLTRFGQGLGATEYDNAYNRYLKGQQNDMSKFSTLSNVGLSGTSLANNALQNAGNLESTNTVNNGRYAGDVNQNVAQFLANLGIQGTNAANQYRIGGANTQAAGILGKADAITGAVNQGIQSLSSLGIGGSGPVSAPAMQGVPLVGGTVPGIGSGARNPYPWLMN